MSGLPFLPVVLWTDALVWLLIAMIVFGVVYVRRRAHLRQPWLRLSRSPSGMVGLTVLMAFVLIGVLDSFHYRPALQSAPGKPVSHAVEVRSVLDILLETLRQQREKTYSAPLAANLYAKETVERPDGTQSREYPRLRHGGAHLENPERDAAGDIWLRALTGAGIGLAVWALLAYGICRCHARKQGCSTGAAWRSVWRREMAFPWSAVLITLLSLLVIVGVTASLATGYHVLGTDKVGQDVLYQTLKSIRTALVIGTLTTLIMLPFAIVLGIAAGYFGGIIDDIIQYLYTTLSSIPGVLLIAAAVLMTQVYIDSHADLFPTAAQRADLRLLFLCIILGITSWTGLCRLLRGETLKLKELEYVQAARAFAVSHTRIIGRHLLPNVMHIVLISVVMEFSGLVLAEAVLSYVGVGVDPSTNSFGTMINNARLEMARDPMVWWSLAAAFVFMVVLVLAANLFADAVRDAFDPRLRSRGGKSTESAVAGAASP
jgi:peptide/nickel transport system permease protein